MTIRKTCPFCGNKEIPRLSARRTYYRCGTHGPDENGFYNTGTECDKTVFCRGFLRYAALLERIFDFAEMSKNHAIIPRSLFDLVRLELQSEQHQTSMLSAVKVACCKTEE